MMTSTTIITLFLHLLILGIHVDASEYFIFQPGRSDLDINNIEHEGNWKDVPCVNDRVVFDPEKIVVTMLGQSLDVNMISLPNDGIIFFDNHATLGEKGEFQCRRKAKSEDAFFTGGTGYYNFHDFGNWEPALDNGRPRLHSQMVPGSQDMVIFDDGHPSMVQIDHHVKVGELYFGDRMQMQMLSPSAVVV